jgi:hypothetical protein
MAARGFGKTFLYRTCRYALPAYVAAFCVWKFVMGADWVASLAGVPLAVLIGVILSALFTGGLAGDRDGHSGWRDAESVAGCATGERPGPRSSF